MPTNPQNQITCVLLPAPCTQAFTPAAVCCSVFILTRVHQVAQAGFGPRAPSPVCWAGVGTRLDASFPFFLEAFLCLPSPTPSKSHPFCCEAVL